MWGGLRGSLSLMYSSMHPLRGRVNRVERTLLNFFMRRGVRGGVFGALEGRFMGAFGAAARHGWAVLPRNSGVFGLGDGATRRFSARRTLPGGRGEKIFKNREPICKLHRSPYRSVSACPTRNSLTFTCGLSLPACRMLVRTISSQSGQETPCHQ